MEIETVINYVANSTNPDGVRAQEIIESLAEDDIEEELGHAQQVRDRGSRSSTGWSPARWLQPRTALAAASRAPDRHRPRHQRRD